MTEHEQLVAETVDRLFQARSVWRSALRVERGVMFDSVTGDQVEQGQSLETQLGNAIADFDIPLSSLSGNVTRYPGIFSVSQETLEATATLNVAKMEFEQAVVLARRAGIPRQRLRKVYAAQGAARIHPKQAWRQVTILPAEDLQSIGFTIAKEMSSISIIDVSEALQMLAHHNAYDIINFIRSSSVSKVRLQMPLSPHVRANVVWGVGEARRSRMVYASLPLLVPAGTWPAKRIRFNSPRNHARRSDTRFTNESMPLPFVYGGSISLVRDTG